MSGAERRAARRAGAICDLRGPRAAGRAQRAERGGRGGDGAVARRAARGRSPRAREPIPACRTGRSGSATIGGVTFVNDSKATNADSAARALVCYDRADLDRRRHGQGRRHRAAGAVLPAHRAALLIGRDAPMLAATLAAHGVPHRDRRHAGGGGSARVATPRAARRASVVLLSPACASLGPVHRLRPARRPLPRRWRGDLPAGGPPDAVLCRAPTPRCSAAGGGPSTAGRWCAIATLIGFGYIMMLAASPAVAERIGTVARHASSSSRWSSCALRRADRRGGVAAVAAGRAARWRSAGCVDRAGADRADAGGRASRSRARGAGSRCRACRCSRANS